MLQSLTQAKMMVSPQTDSTIRLFKEAPPRLLLLISLLIANYLPSKIVHFAIAL